MSSFRQIEANRSNALRSTGPKTEDGKRRSRRNAVRHGLTAETIILALEDIEDYQAFEAAVTLDYDARTAVERELVLRLASLLWRLRRATAVETDLLQIQAETLIHRQHENTICDQLEQKPVIYRVLQQAPCSNLEKHSESRSRCDGSPDSIDDQSDRHSAPGYDDPSVSRKLTFCFLRLANLDNGLFDRLGRYEAALWRQTVQTLFALQTSRRR
jgi:hypothetical protein